MVSLSAQVKCEPDLNSNRNGESSVADTPVKDLLNTPIFEKFESNFEKRDRKLLEKIEFAKLVRQNKNILFGDLDGCDITIKKKEEVWKRIHQHLVDLNYGFVAGKTWMRIRDHDWQYVRRHAIARSDSGKTSGLLGELDAIVMDCVAPTVGRGSEKNGEKEKGITPEPSTSFDAIRHDVDLLVTQAQQSDYLASLFGNASFPDQTEAQEEEIEGEETDGPSTSIHSAFEAMWAAQSTPLEDRAAATRTPSNGAAKATVSPAGPGVESSRRRAYPFEDESPAQSANSNSKIAKLVNRLSERASTAAAATAEESLGVSHEETLHRLEREKLEVELEGLRKKEERAQELHDLDLENRRLENALLKAKLAAISRIDR